MNRKTLYAVERAALAAVLRRGPDYVARLISPWAVPRSHFIEYGGRLVGLKAAFRAAFGPRFGPNTNTRKLRRRARDLGFHVVVLR